MPWVGTPLLYDDVVYPVPTTLSPSRVESFLSCPLAFRFSAIERLPEPPQAHLTKGQLVHRALELFYTLDSSDRHAAAANAMFDRAVDEFRTLPDFIDLGLDDDASRQFLDDARALTHACFTIEDPTAVRPIGLELRLEGSIGDVTVRGVIDRLDLDDEGRLVITDYKTGKAPSAMQRHDRLSAVQCYAFLCEQLFGSRPAEVRLLYLRSSTTVTATPTEASQRFVANRTAAVWQAVERACRTGDFRTKRSPLCAWCAFQRWCPEFGGDPSLAAVEAPRVNRPAAA